VPADRLVEATAELEPLFALLADAEAEADRLRIEADQHIAEGHRLAAERAADVLAQARLDAEAARADAAAEARAAANHAAEQELAAAAAEASRIRQSANERMDAQLSEIVAAVRERLAAFERP
jgi:hypothetical protein